MTLLGLLLLGGPASAQAPEDLREARVAIENGTDHFRAERYQRAVTEFRTALAVLREPGLIWNIARAYEELGDVRNALHYFQELVDKFPADGSTAEAKARIDKLKPRLPGSLVVDCGAHANAQLRVDGRPAECGKRIGLLKPGEHALEASNPERGTWKATVTIGADMKHELQVPWDQASKIESAPVAVATNAAPRNPRQPATAEPNPAPAASQGVPASALALGGGGLMLLGSAVFAALAARADKQTYEVRGETKPVPEILDQHSTAESHQTTSLVLLGVGVAASAAGALLWWSASDSAPPLSAALTPLPGGAAVVLRWQGSP